ncbi:MAG: nitroreductase family protein [Candidatus Nanohaloarchaea archaeon]|nr:nitroreductase family protein [Candidatus Nanohaloarchaea archaeon]
MNPDEFLETLQTRATVKKYTSEGVDRKKIGKILEAARWAPSAGNMQSWEFLIVEDQDLKDKLSEYAYNQEHLRDAPLNIVVLGNVKTAKDRYEDRGELYMIQENAAAMQNMLLMADMLGLGAAWVGAFQEEKVKDLLKIPEKLRPLSIITLGHPKERPRPSNKHRVSDVTYIDKYGDRTHPLYDRIVWKGLAEYGRKAKNAIKNKLKDRD